MIIVCQKCQTENTKNSVYCRNCGVDLTGVQPTEDQTDKQIKKVVSTSKNIVIKIVSGFFLLMAIGIASIIGKVAAKSATEPSQEEKKTEMIKMLQGFADDTNPTLPKMVDEITQMDKITVGSDLRLIYHQSTPKYSRSDLDINAINNYKQTVTNSICSKEETLRFIGDDGVYEYIVNDKNGVEIADVIVTRSDCNI
jgi:hypothetical protein